MAAYLPFDPNPRAPRVAPPAGSCDCQFHVFGSPDRYPVRPGASYQMPTATADELRRLHATLGIDRGVFVQSTTYGTDNRILLDFLAAAGPGYRGCVIAATLDTASDADLDRLHAAGVRAARFNFLRSLNMLPSPEAFARSAARLAELGWCAKIQPDYEGIVPIAPIFERASIPVVIDHMARPPTGEGVHGPTVRRMVELLERGNFWVMLSNGHKISPQDSGWDDVVPIAHAYIEAAPDRVIWASDWPHPLSPRQPPNDGDLMELLYRYAPDAAMLRRILVENPARLFGFPD